MLSFLGLDVRISLILIYQATAAKSLVENWVVEFIEDLIGIKTLWMHDSFSGTIKSAATNHILFY
jgi:hypothetical protein